MRQPERRTEHNSGSGTSAVVVRLISRPNLGQHQDDPTKRQEFDDAREREFHCGVISDGDE